MAQFGRGKAKQFKNMTVQVGILEPGGQVGTVGASTVSAVEYGDGVSHTTVLTLSTFAVGTAPDNASLGLGALVYTFPAGIIIVDSAAMVALGSTAALSSTAQTPEIGLGTVVASGAVDVLGGTATFENIFEGTAIADVAGTAFNGTDFPNGASSVPLIIAAASAHTVYLNYAVAWANVTAAGALTASGTIVLKWRKVG